MIEYVDFLPCYINIINVDGSSRLSPF